MVRAGAGSGPAARASGAVFRSWPTTMMAAPEGGGERCDRGREVRHDVHGRNSKLEPRAPRGLAPSRHSVGGLSRRDVNFCRACRVSACQSVATHWAENESKMESKAEYRFEKALCHRHFLYGSIPPAPASQCGFRGPVPKAAKKARKQQAFANSPLVSTFPFRCVGRPNYRKSPANSANIPVFGRPRLETWFDHHCQVRRAVPRSKRRAVSLYQ
jgi:hypothetical protein